MNNAENLVPVPFPLVAALVQYLAARPYREVHELIAGLQAANEAANQLAAASSAYAPASTEPATLPESRHKDFSQRHES